jgi:transposase
VKNPKVSARAKTPYVERWGLTRCDNCARLWDRDVNAALNILRIGVLALAHNWARPAYLTLPVHA